MYYSGLLPEQVHSASKPLLVQLLLLSQRQNWEIKFDNHLKGETNLLDYWKLRLKKRKIERNHILCICVTIGNLADHRHKAPGEMPLALFPLLTLL